MVAVSETASVAADAARRIAPRHRQEGLARLDQERAARGSIREQSALASPVAAAAATACHCHRPRRRCSLPSIVIAEGWAPC